MVVITELEPTKKNVTLAGFGVDCVSVVAPTGVNIDKLTEFLKKSNACQREHIEYSYKYDHEDDGKTCYVFAESGEWNLWQ